MSASGAPCHTKNWIKVFVGEKCGKLAEQRVDAADTIDARLVVDPESGMIALDKPPATIKWE